MGKKFASDEIDRIRDLIIALEDSLQEHSCMLEAAVEYLSEADGDGEWRDNRDRFVADAKKMIAAYMASETDDERDG